MKLAKTVLEATLTVARLACQSRGDVWTGRKEPFGHTSHLSRSRGALSPAGP